MELLELDPHHLSIAKPHDGTRYFSNHSFFCLLGDVENEPLVPLDALLALPLESARPGDGDTRGLC